MEADGLAALGNQIERLTKAAAVFPQAVGKLPPGKLLFQKPDGNFIEKDIGPGFSNNQLDTPSDVLAYIKSEEIGSAGAVFISQSGVVVLKNIDDQRERAYADLKWSDQYEMLAKKLTVGLTQAQFVLHLRSTFAESWPSGGPNLVRIFGNLKWATGANGERIIEHGKDSYGKQVNAKVESAGGEIPEQTSLDIPIFEVLPDVRFSVRCAIDVSPADQRFSLIPYPQQTARAMDAAVKHLSTILTVKDGPPVFRGTPRQG